MFRTFPLSIIRSFSLYTQQWHVFIQVLLTACEQDQDDPARNRMILLASCLRTCMTYTISVSAVKNS